MTENRLIHFSGTYLMPGGNAEGRGNADGTGGQERDLYASGEGSVHNLGCGHGNGDGCGNSDGEGEAT